MADVIATLRAEIAGLQKQLDTRRRALTILAGPAPKPKAATPPRPMKAAAAQRPSRPPAKSLATRIREYLAAHKDQKFAPAQIADALQKRDKTVRRDNVQRRLSDMAKTKKVKRENGRYSLA
jgi:outer membrane protein TolC